MVTFTTTLLSLGNNVGSKSPRRSCSASEPASGSP